MPSSRTLDKEKQALAYMLLDIRICIVGAFATRKWTLEALQKELAAKQLYIITCICCIC